MGYSVYFKGASLKQILTFSAGNHVRDCYDAVRAVMAQESPNDLVMRVTRSLQAWNLTGELNPALEEKLKGMPFVARVERHGHKTPPPVIAGWLRRMIYGQ